MKSTSLLLKTVNTLYFIAIMILAIYFGKERAVFCDSSMQLFDMARTKNISVDVSMLTSAVNYIFPYVAILLGAPIKVVVYLLAFNYLLLPILVFIFLKYKQQGVKYELIFIVSFSIFNWQTFYYPIHEYWTGYFLLFCLYRILDDSQFSLNKNKVLLFVYLLILAIVFTHLTVVISLFILYLFLYVSSNVNKTILYRLLIFTFLILIVKIFIFNNMYQNSVLESGDFSFSSVINFWKSKTISEFLSTLFVSNLNFFILLLISFLYLYYNNKMYLLCLAVFIVIPVFVVNLFFKNFGYNVYTEGHFKSLNIVPCIFIGNILLELISKYRLLIGVVVVNCIFSVCVLISGGKIFEKQYDFINRSCRMFNSTAYLTSNKDICPLECLTVSRQSLIINQIENNSNNCIFSNIGNEEFVNNLNSLWINSNLSNPVASFVFNKSIRYYDADSMQFPIDSFSIIFKTHTCDDLLKRLDQ